MYKALISIAIIDLCRATLFNFPDPHIIVEILLFNYTGNRGIVIYAEAELNVFAVFQ